MQTLDYPTEVIIEVADRFNRNLKKHFDKIKQFCPKMDQNFFFRFKALYYELQTTSPHQETADKINELNREIDDQIDHLKEVFIQVRYYFLRAFPYDTELLDQYSMFSCKADSDRRAQMVDCFMRFSQLIKNRSIELKIANCPLKLMDEVQRRSNALSRIYTEFQLHKQESDDRDKKFHAICSDLIELMVKINEAAKSCLKDNPEAMGLFSLPDLHIHR